MLTQRIEFAAIRDAAIFAAVPATPGVFQLQGGNPEAEPYVSKTANLRRRLQRLLGAPTEQSRRLNLRDRVCWIEYTPTGSDFESVFLLYRLLRKTFPKTYDDRLRLRFAPLVKLHLDNKYPRASITARLGRLNGRSLYYGPFPSRTAAEKFANDSLDFFKMRRCVDDLHPDPAFPGCIYSEMKMCLAPCFKGCTDEKYRTEVTRVQEYFDSGGDSLVREISGQREAASSGLEFEHAAALHAQVEKLKPVLSQLPEIVRRIDRLTGVIVQPGVVQPGIVQLGSALETVAFFRLDAGRISGPVPFPIQSPEHTRSQSMESRVLEALAAAPPTGNSTSREAMEHLAILKRWYYRSHRVGEIFCADEKGNLPLRRLVRERERESRARLSRGKIHQRSGAGTKYPTPAHRESGNIMNASADKSLRAHLLYLLKGGGAHANFDEVVASLPAKLRGQKPSGLPHSPWMLLEHMRLAQQDILEFSRNPKYISPAWPEGYWPRSQTPPNAAAWGKSIQAFRTGLRAMQKLVENPKTDLHARIPWGEGQTILREALLLADHNAYHLGQFLDLRRLLGAWPE